MVDGRVAELVAQHGAATGTLRAQINEWLAEQWNGLGAWRQADIERLVPLVVARVEAAQTRMAALTDSYLSQVLTELAGEPVPMVGVAPGDVSTAALRGVPGEEVYMRPGQTVWYRLSEGDEITAAQAQGLQRLQKIAASGMQLAKTRTSQRVMLDAPKKVVGYRRVLVGRTNCALCIVASTQRYRRGDLQPMHPGCDCSTLPIWGEEDPGWVIDSEQLDRVHETLRTELGTMSGSAGKLSAEDAAIAYRDVVLTRQHGELGAVLTVRSHAFRGPSDIQR